jgi:Flp pilus assembly protein TadD
MPVRALARERLLALLAAGACLLIAGWLALHARDEARLRAANELGLRGDVAGALTKARTVRRAPAAERALLVEAYAEAVRDRPARSAALFARAARRDPRDWTLQRDWARALLAAGDRAGAARRMAVAVALNPRLRVPSGFRLDTGADAP